MSREDVGSLGLKMAGIFCLVQSVPMLQGVTTIGALQGQYGDSGNEVVFILLATLIPFILLFCSGFFLIAASGRLSVKLFPDHPGQSEPSHAKAPDVQAILFSVVGVVLAAIALPKILMFGLQLTSLTLPEFSDAKASLWRNTWPQTTAYIIQLAIGLLLFLRGQGLASYWHRLQQSRPMKR